MANVCATGAPTVVRPAKLWGVDANYVAAFEDAGGEWRVDGANVDPIATLKAHGANVFRLRIWVENQPGNLEPGTLADARPLARRAQAAGLYVIPTLFMSKGWGADSSQDAPLHWGSLSLADRAAAARQWAAEATRQLRTDGIQTRTYGIGNETDYGFCGVFQMTSDLGVLRQTIWPQAATLMKATIQGIEEAAGRTDLEFILHISRGHDTELALAFFETMRNQGVKVSLAGLSYYPSSWGQSGHDQFDVTVSRLHSELGLRVFVPEYAYPAESRWSGWNHAIAGYPLDEAGQAKFVRDLRSRVFTDSRFEGAIYWTPEEALTDADWSVMGLFVPSPDRKSPAARAALDALGGN